MPFGMVVDVVWWVVGVGSFGMLVEVVAWGFALETDC